MMQMCFAGQPPLTPHPEPILHPSLAAELQTTSHHSIILEIYSIFSLKHRVTDHWFFAKSCVSFYLFVAFPDEKQTVLPISCSVFSRPVHICHVLQIPRKLCELIASDSEGRQEKKSCIC